MAKTVKRDEAEILFDGSSGHPAVIAFDPGGVTGWAVMRIHPLSLTEPGSYSILDNIEFLQLGQIVGGEREQVDAMLGLYEQWPGAATVIEDFILRQFRMDRALLSPVRLTAAFRYAVGEGPAARSFVQQPSLAMTTMTDERLHALGYYERTVGKQHARDALRHLFTFGMRLRKDSALLARAFPALAS